MIKLMVKRQVMAHNLTALDAQCEANSAHIRQSRPDSGRGFQVEVLETFQGIGGAARGELGTHKTVTYKTVKTHMRQSRHT